MTVDCGAVRNAPGENISLRWERITAFNAQDPLLQVRVNDEGKVTERSEAVSGLKQCDKVTL